MSSFSENVWTEEYICVTGLGLLGGGGSLATGLDLLTLWGDFSLERLDEEFPWFCVRLFIRRSSATLGNELSSSCATLTSP